MPALALLAAALTAAAAPSVTRYDFLSGGKTAGSLVRTDAPGEVRVEFAYLENGRGPKLSERYTLGADGQVATLEITGTNTFGGRVEERFTRGGGKASWKTLADQGETRVQGPATYLPIVNSPELDALTFRQALVHGGALRLLPGGEIRVERLRTLTVKGAGGPRQVTLHVARGVTFQPVFLWLDADGRLFSDVGDSQPPFGTIRAGYAAEAPRLAAAVKQAQASLLDALATRTRHVVKPPLAITGVNVFDPVTGQRTGPSTVYLFRGRITSVVPAAKPVPDDVAVVDGEGKTLLPALIDMHAHEWPWNAALQLAGGVTTIRDLGNTEREILELEEKAGTGQWVGPRIWRSGFVEGDSPFASRFSGVVVPTLDDALAAEDRYARLGYRGIKLYNSIKPEWMAPLAAHARELGLRVSGHVPAFARARDAILAGYMEIHHVNQLLLNFVSKEGEDSRTLARFTTVAERAADLDLDGPAFQDFVRLMLERGVGHDPTVTVFEDLFTHAPGEPSASYGMVAVHLPASFQRGLRMAAMEADGPTRERYRASFGKMLQVVKRLDDAGVTLVAGTDGLAGFTLHRELELWVKAGIPPARVLHHATLGAAKVLGWDQELGRVAPGYSADVILVDGDPTQDISAIRRVAMAVKQGDVYFPAELYRELGVKPFVEAPQLRLPAFKVTRPPMKPLPAGR
ncbi:MAG: amidohydrolase family protein [Anaeromyxobacter sp.]